MLLNLTDKSSESLQDQIIRQIRAKILNGELETDDDLPSIRSFARKNHISVITVQRAYEKLMQEGLIHSRRSKGFFVSALTDIKKKKLSLQRLTESIEPLLKTALIEGLSPEDISDTINKVLKQNSQTKEQSNE